MRNVQSIKTKQTENERCECVINFKGKSYFGERKLS
jgi:hypothetical protein